jgi:hypothetical protein
MTKKAKIESAALAMLLVVAGTIWYTYRHPGVGSARVASLVVHYVPMGVENPQIHRNRLLDAKNTEYTSRGRNIFTRDLPLPPPPPPVLVPKLDDADLVPLVVPPPPPPQLPLKFFGYGPVTGGSGRRAFLTDGDAVYIVGEGDTLLGHFRIVKIYNRSLEFEEIGSGRHGSVALEDQGPAI